VRLRDEKSNNKKIKVMKERFLEKFIMMEFVKGNLDSQEQVNEMITLIQKKLGISVENAGDFLRKAVGLI
jgi:hypothetical protein